MYNSATISRPIKAFDVSTLDAIANCAHAPAAVAASPMYNALHCQGVTLHAETSGDADTCLEHPSCRERATFGRYAPNGTPRCGY